MPRWRKRSRRALSDEERTLLLGGYPLVRRGTETEQACVERIFGSWAAAREAWEAFRVQLETIEALPGVRCWAWWQFSAGKWERERDLIPPPGLKIRPHVPTKVRPIPYDQAATLRRLGALTELETLQLRESS